MVTFLEWVELKESGQWTPSTTPTPAPDDLSPRELYFRNDHGKFIHQHYKKIAEAKTHSGEPYEIYTSQGSFSVYRTRDYKQLATAHVVDEYAPGQMKSTGLGNYLTSVSVDGAYRRQGIASTLYAVIEAHIGKSLVPSPTYQTSDAKGFWRNRASHP